MFSGTYDAVFDNSGRLTIPAKVRGAVVDEVYVTRALPPGRCLWLFTEQGFMDFVQRVFPVESLRAVDRNLKRYIVGDAYPLKLDKAGRVLVPERLRQFAGITGPARVVGVGAYLEVWSEAVHNQWLDEADTAEMEAVAEAAMDRLTSLQEQMQRTR